MASTDPEIKDRFPLPVWMKSKPARDFEPFAASPPGPEDSFYIRYPKKEVFFGKPNVEQDLSKVLGEQSNELTSAVSYVKDKDWSKHTKPCQDVLHGIAPINTAAVTLKPKPAGTDDGFKGEGAACGSSVLKVAHQMISSGRTSRGFRVASPGEEGDGGEGGEGPAADGARYNRAARRGSRSLPASPAHSPSGSPTARRKGTGNRYFTSPFAPVEDAANRSWLTMALLGFKKDLTTSTSTLAEEDAIEARLQGVTLAQSVENLGPAPKSRESKLPSSESSTQQPKLSKPAHSFRPKPTELREMNFWSPTSM